MIPVIISGGSGTRLWPLSRNKFPKQFVNLFGASLQSKTIKRLLPLGEPLILTNSQLKVLTEKQLQELKLKLPVLYEPVAKNTAPAVAFLCQYLKYQNQSEQVVVVCPSDHLIRNEEMFRRSLSLAERYAKEGQVITLGISPTSPETGYGYIEADHQECDEVFKVLKFHEKPQLDKAKEYLAAGNFYWNAGIFVFKVSTMLSHLQKHSPEVFNCIQNLKPDLSNLKEVFTAMPSISIDYAVMEKLTSQELRVMPAAFDWSDVGSWDSVVEQREPAQNNILLDTKEVHFLGLEHKTYSAIGVNDLVIIDTEDALLVARRGDTQRVREVVDYLKKNKPALAEDHVFEFRPWGDFEVLRDTDKFKSKVIHVNPGAQISYQSHSKRSEHWIIVSGQGEVVLEDQIIPIQAGSHVHIPQNAKHRIRNTGIVPIEFIEVQLGTYFGEDDIIRYEDDFGRV
ncbi:MAG: mannose-1-phosphate guanylyltransferase/mannose-6-phosphate isomerase [Bdellovibrionia bacterium]